MQNASGENVELYIPRKCSWTNRLIAAKDHGAIQLNVGVVDGSGILTDKLLTYALAGKVRERGESDLALTELVTRDDRAMRE